MTTFSWTEEFDEEEAGHIKDIIRTSIEHLDDTSRFQQAASSLDRLVSQKRHESGSNSIAGDGDVKVENFMWYLQEKFIHIATLVPHDSPAQSNLVLLLWMLRRFPDESQSSPCPEWRELFLDHMQFSEAFISANVVGGLSGTGDTNAESYQQMRYRNFNSFSARLYAQDFTNLAKYGLWSLRDALEEPNYGWGSEYNPAPPDLAINVALDWLFIAGKRLYSYDQHPYNQHIGEGYRDTVGDLWKGPNGFSAERWYFWAQRLEAASLDETLLITTRARAADGAQMIAARPNGENKGSNVQMVNGNH